MAGVFYNKIKYNPGEVNHSCCLQKSGSVFDIGVNRTYDYGPTFITDFWNGISIPAGSLASFQYKPFQGPSIFLADNVAQFISKANNMALGVTFTSTTEALSYIARQVTDVVVLNETYPSVRTNNLTLLLDPGCTASYPWLDNAMYDLSGNFGGTANLVSGATWYSAGTSYASSYVEFVATRQSEKIQVTNFGTALGVFTIIIWVNFASTTPSDQVNIISQVPVGQANSNFLITLDGSGQVIGGYKKNNTLNTVVIDPAPQAGTWKQYALTYDGTELKGYVNGSQSNAAFASDSLTNNNQPTIIGGTTNNSINNGVGNYMNGKVGHIMIYSTGLNATEIQNSYDNFVYRY